MRDLCLESVLAQRVNSLETRGESAPSIPELAHPATEDHGAEMPGQDNTGEETSRMTLERRRKSARRNMPNTITLIQHRMRKGFARVYGSKLSELAFLMRKGEDTSKREGMNLLVWAIPALILSEDEAGADLHKEHHSKTAGLNQRLAAAEKNESDSLSERACREQQEDEERTDLSSNQLEVN